MWLKFNDNTVSEVTWDELVKESVGGTSNTSAYSLVYIDASKPELLMDSHDKMAQTDQGKYVCAYSECLKSKLVWFSDLQLWTFPQF